MQNPESEHSGWHAPVAWAVAGALAFSLVAGAAAPALARTTGAPDFAWPYGRVQAAGGNVSPIEQPVIALVNGRACGEGSTKLAQAGTGVPAGDVGKTVYVVDVLADGTNPGQRPGCGTAGATIRLYFPVSRRIASQQAAFAPGPQRFDVDLGPELGFRLAAPVVAGDGAQ